MARILFIDDDLGGRQMAAYNLRKAGHAVTEAEDGLQGLRHFAESPPDLVITDVRMPGLSGVQVTAKIHEQAPEALIVVITAFGNIETAVTAMRAGAYDFVLKPFSREQMLIVVDKALAHRALAQENKLLRRKVRGIERPMIYVSEAMQATVQMADRVATSDATALVTGQSGTGKELIARRIHARSAREQGPFVPVNCAAIPESLVEAELFGHEKGAFSGADRARAGRFRQAEGGTLFLDEVAELPLQTQVKLLRVLQESVVDVLGSDVPVAIDVRVITATNKDLRAEVEAGRFREDLYYRLNVVEIEVPPLRARSEDIPRLVEYFVAAFSKGREIRLSDEVLSSLIRRPWPGNVRELKNACERMVVLCPGAELSTDVLVPIKPRRDQPASQGPWADLPPDGLSLLDLERTLIERVLALKNGNLSEAARYLRVPRHILVYRVEKYGIPRQPKI